MYFYVYFDPEIIRDADSKGNFGLKYLEGILKGFVVNCALICFPDQIEELKVYVMEIPECFEVKEIKTLLSWLKKNNRFVTTLVPDYIGNKSSTKSLYEQYEDYELDVIILSLANYEEYKWNVEIANIDNYNQTAFEKSRYAFCINGKTLDEDEYSEQDFLDNFFKKLLFNARQIEICDYSFGLNFREDYIYSWRKFILWFKSIIGSGSETKIIIHTDKRDQGMADYMISELKSQLPTNFNGVEIFLKLYVAQSSKTALPHERFLYTDQFAVNFGRGMDFFKESTKKNRNTSISYMSSKEVKAKVEKCKIFLDTPPEIKIC